MRLTRRKALDIAIELWTWLAETGKEKDDWPGWEKYEEMEGGCPFCEYSARHGRGCDCPFGFVVQPYGNCYATPFDDWEGAELKSGDKKRFAAAFLSELKSIKIPRGSWKGCYWKQKG